ncbi:MAG TPA: diguanylate cyclase [Candidatus Baltobacteraceae bacterium]|jgi:diguanylate cyclase (GGDEF)-like protein|nr:diguanylate cyclase [Candidatus Baltobacteraceae bacterium]
MTQAIWGAFAGFFLAMSLVNVIAAQLTRSRASAAYAVLMATAIGLAASPLLGSSGLLRAAFVSLYLICTVVFALTLLRTLRYDRTIGWIVAGVLIANVPLVFAESLLRERWHFFVVDQIALDALLATLVVLGVRALAYEGSIAGSYLAGVAGPIAGAIVNDLSVHKVIPDTDALVFTFFLGIAWEAAFFAYAVALRNRGIQTERDRFERLAYLDGLTGVANRRTFDETLVRMWNVARRAKVPIAVAMVDIDHFKRLNDTRGHQVGDECLRRVAALCSSALRRAGDCFARYGGEEFAAILVNIDLDHAVTLTEHMRKVVERDGGITISVGIASRVPTPSDDPRALVADADEALYRAKHEGRNCVRVAAPAVSPVAVP